MNPGDLAASQDLEHERQAMCDELLRVLVFLDAAEVLEQALDQWAAVLHRAGAQRLQPGVQRPWNAWWGEENHRDTQSEPEHWHRWKLDGRGGRDGIARQSQPCSKHRGCTSSRPVKGCVDGCAGISE